MVNMSDKDKIDWIKKEYNLHGNTKVTLMKIGPDEYCKIANYEGISYPPGLIRNLKLEKLGIS